MNEQKWRKKWIEGVEDEAKYEFFTFHHMLAIRKRSEEDFFICYPVSLLEKFKSYDPGFDCRDLEYCVTRDEDSQSESLTVTGFYKHYALSLEMTYEDGELDMGYRVDGKYHTTNQDVLQFIHQLGQDMLAFHMYEGCRRLEFLYQNYELLFTDDITLEKV